MSTWSPSNAAKARERFWRTAPKDPTRQAARAGVPYFRPGKDRILMPSDFMPVGVHAGKHLDQVPVEYLRWVNAQPWAASWIAWQPVADFISRFIFDSEETPRPTVPEIGFILEACPSSRYPYILKVSTRKHTDYLHTFALGALDLKREWCIWQPYPHYTITTRVKDRALAAGAELLP
jgi:hypothetical protein